MTTLRDMPRVAVIGNGACDHDTAEAAFELGRRLAEAGCLLVCGGLGGVMEAACKGAKAAGGTTMGILPGDDIKAANRYVDIPVATSLSHMRNYLVVTNACVVVAVEGSAGTISELALAVKSGRKVIALGRLAALESLVTGVAPARDLDQAMALLKDTLEAQ